MTVRSLLSRVTYGLLTLAVLGCNDGQEPSPEPPPDAPEPPPEAPPDAPAGKIVFQTSSHPPDLYLVNADGSALTRLTAYGDADLSPSWSGDGRQIYFLSYNRDGRGAYDLYAMNPDGSDVHLVVDSLYSWAYDVSPDGTRIAFGLGLPEERPAQADLFVMNLDGTGLTRLVDLPTEYCDGNFFDCEDIEAVAWSPDGQQIAYSTHRFGRGCGMYSNIGIVNADGTGQQLLVEGGWSGSPAWAPDGQRIAFASGEPTCIPKPRDLEIMNADGTGRRVLVDGDVDGMVNTSPSWSPDGQAIVFSRSPLFEPDESELFAVNVDGTGLRRVTGVPGGAFAPDWNPAAP